MNKVTCSSGVELLMEYLEGTLPPDVVSALETHVLGCPRCTAFVASYRATPQLLREATPAEMPPDLEIRLREFLRDKRKSG